VLFGFQQLLVGGRLNCALCRSALIYRLPVLESTVIHSVLKLATEARKMNS